MSRFGVSTSIVIAAASAVLGVGVFHFATSSSGAQVQEVEVPKEMSDPSSYSKKVKFDYRTVFEGPKSSRIFVRGEVADCNHGSTLVLKNGEPAAKTWIIKTEGDEDSIDVRLWAPRPAGSIEAAFVKVGARKPGEANLDREGSPTFRVRDGTLKWRALECPAHPDPEHRSVG